MIQTTTRQKATTAHHHSQAYGSLSHLQNAFLETCEPTVGVEVELFLVDQQTGQPVPIYDDVYDLLPSHIQQQTQPEFLACQIEYATAPHRNIAGVRAELEEFEQAVTAAAAQLGARPEWTAILPDWEFDPAMIRDSERSRWNAERFGESVSTLAACSVHIHVAVPRGQAIQVADGLQQLVPLLVALSANSPQMPGSMRHVQSQRAAMWSHDLPTSGFPRLFGDWANLTRHLELLQDFGVIASQKDLYYFVRPTRYGTIEVRCCDLPPSLDHVVALASLVQASAVRFQQGCSQPIPTDILHADLANAITHGSQAMLTSCELSRVPLSECFESLLSELLPIGTALDNDKDLMAANCLVECTVRRRRISDNPGKKRQLVGTESSDQGTLVAALRRWSPGLTLGTSVCLFLAATLLQV